MILTTERLSLRPFDLKDADDVFEYSKNEVVGKMAGWKAHANIGETIEVMNAIFLNQETMFAIEYEGKVIGSAGFIPDMMRQNQQCLMLGYALSEDYWGRGFMTECCKALIDYAFKSLNINTISVTCYSDNPLSERVIEKCGFEYEGTLHDAEIMYDGEVKDKKCFYLTKEMHKQSLDKDVF